MKLTLLIVSCLLFAAVHSAAVDLDSVHITDAELSLMQRAAAQAPTKEDVKAILKQAEIDLQAAINEVDESVPEPVISNGEKRSVSPVWTLKINRRSPQDDPWKISGDYDIFNNRLGGSVPYNNGDKQLTGSGYYDLDDKRYGVSLSYQNGEHNFDLSGSGGQGGSQIGATYTVRF